MGKFIDITGLRFGKLVVQFRMPFQDRLGVVWLCQCDCGNVKLTVSAALRTGFVKSCGCWKIENNKSQHFRDRVRTSVLKLYANGAQLGFKKSPCPPEACIRAAFTRKARYYPDSNPYRTLTGSFTGAEWRAVKLRFRNTCPCCGRSEPEIKLHKDHIWPVALGGLNIIENIQPLCERCNKKKRIKIVKYRPPGFRSGKRQMEELLSGLSKMEALGLKVDYELAASLGIDLKEAA